MKEIHIRTATLADLPTLREFEQGIIKAERPFDSTLRPGPISYYDIGALIESDEAEVVVAQVGEELVGSAYAKIVSSLPYLSHTHHAYLGFMYVKPEYRRKGINSKIMDALKTWAKARNITELRLDVYHENGPATNSYEKAGFEKYLVNMRMEI